MLRRKAPLLTVIAVLIFSAIAPALAGGYSAEERAKEARGRGDHSLAAQEFAHAARILFWRKDLYEQAGISAAQAGQFPEAIRHFERGDGFSEDGWVWYCASTIQEMEYSNAVAVCQDGVEAYDSPRLYSLLAYAHRSRKEWDAERLALTDQTRLDPADAFAAYRLSLLLMLTSPEDAPPELTRAATLNPEADSAIQTLRSALAVSDQEGDPSMKKVVIGRAFGLVQEWDLAATVFEEALALDESNAEAWVWLGEANQQMGTDGSEELNRALSLDPESVNVRALRALYWGRQGKYEQMLAEYLLAAGIEPENPRWQAGVGEAQTKLGRLVEALAAYQRAAELAPAEPEYWRLLALFCVENGAQAEEVGLPAAQQAYSLAPDDVSVLDALGYAYLSTGRYASAEKALMNAIEASPEYFSAYIHLAMTYLAQGNRAGAFDMLVFVRDAPGAGVYAETARQLLDKYFP